MSRGGKIGVLALLGICALLAAPAIAADIRPGAASVSANAYGYRLTVRVAPNSSRRWNDVELRLSRGGAAVGRANVAVRFDMPAMSMGDARFRMREVRPGVYRYTGPAISMPGLWVLRFDLSPYRGRAFTFVVRDHVRG